MVLPVFLKWAGGKRRILKKLDCFFPDEINYYYEPFLGAAPVFFHVKQKYNPEKCVISDINLDLIRTFRAVRDNPERIIMHLGWFKKNHSKKFYYETRDKFNQNKYQRVRRAAAFIYLNKTCFNGIYRVNKQNKFNVPMGRYKDPNILEENKIRSASELLQCVDIRHCDYRKIKEEIEEGSFVYLDPCYDPLKRTSFAHYTPDRFQEEDRVELSKFIRFAHNHGARVLLSNNDIDEVRALYSEEFTIKEIMVSRCINSDVSNRKAIQEIVVKTFD